MQVFVKKARQTGCLNNMKQLGTGTRMYMDNWDDTYPMTGSIGRPGWIYALADFKIDVQSLNGPLTAQDFVL